MHTPILTIKTKIRCILAGLHPKMVRQGVPNAADAYSAKPHPKTVRQNAPNAANPYFTWHSIYSQKFFLK